MRDNECYKPHPDRSEPPPRHGGCRVVIGACNGLDVRRVHAGVRAHETVMRFGNQDAAIHANDSLRLGQHDLDDPRSLPPSPPPIRSHSG
jgi:hypothetical protein